MLSPLSKLLVVVIPETDPEMKHLSNKDQQTPIATGTPSDSASTEDPKKKKQRKRESSSEREIRKRQERREKRKNRYAMRTCVCYLEIQRSRGKEGNARFAKEGNLCFVSATFGFTVDVVKPGS